MKSLVTLIVLFLVSPASAAPVCDTELFKDPRVLARFESLPAAVKAVMEANSPLPENHVTVTSPGMVTFAEGAKNTGIAFIEDIRLSNGVYARFTGLDRGLSPMFELHPGTLPADYDDFGRVLKPERCAVYVAVQTFDSDVTNATTNQLIQSIRLPNEVVDAIRGWIELP